MIRGLRLEWKKEKSLLHGGLKSPLLPEKVTLRLGGGAGGARAAEPCVKPGEQVRTGQVIAKTEDPEGVFVHASLSGSVTAVDYFQDAYGKPALSVEIHSDGRDSRLEEIGRERKNWETLEPAGLQNIFRASGLVGLGGAMKPVHVKTQSASSGVDRGTLVVNACESEPYVTCDYGLGMAHPLEILKGAELLRRASGRERIAFAVQKNALDLAEVLKSKIFFLKWPHAEVRVLEALYPMGDERLLVRELGRKSRRPPQDFTVFNPATAFAVYEAVVLQKPLYERVVTVSGECVIEPRNFWARLGTPFRHLVKSAKGLMREPGKFVMGGPMKGIAQKDWEAFVLPGTQALLALPEELVKRGPEEPCIRCGRCLEVCPAEISPAMITLALERKYFTAARDYGLEECLECGNCAFICPSNRPMMELITSGLGRGEGFRS